MPIRTIVDRAIESAEHGNGGILLNGTDGSSSNANSFLVLDASKSATIDVNEKIEFEKETIAEENIEKQTIVDFKTNFDAIELENEDGFLLMDSSASGVDIEDRIVYDATFVDRVGLFNINTLGSGGTALKVNTGATGFEFGSAGTHELLETTTISTNTGNVTFLDMNTRGFNVYMFEVECMRPQTDNTKPSLVVAGTDGTIDTGSIYNYCAKGHTSSASDIDNGNNTATAYRIFGDSVQTGNETDEGCSFRMYMYNAADSVKFTQFHCQGISVGSNYCVAMTSACNVYEASVVTTAVRFLFNSDNIAAGTFKLYGVN